LAGLVADIVAGDDDQIVGKAIAEFEAQFLQKSS
jgi:hypothetical protein